METVSSIRKHYVKHENLKRYLEKLHTEEGLTDEESDLMISEIKHSNLILAADIYNDSYTTAYLTVEGKKYGLLFTDMQEFNRTMGSEECGSYSFNFHVFKQIADYGHLDGFIINPESEGLIFGREFMDEAGDLPEHEYYTDETYTADELKIIKKSIDNTDLEEFIMDSSNTARYEELFEKISHSTLLTLMLSREDLQNHAKDGVISLTESEPMGFLYIHELGGNYATVYTSEDKMKSITTNLHKYSQLVNFSQMVNFVLNDDLDGIIINPLSENIMLSRDVLLEYSMLLEKTCNDRKLNSAIMHLFLIKEE